MRLLKLAGAIVVTLWLSEQVAVQAAENVTDTSAGAPLAVPAQSQRHHKHKKKADVPTTNNTTASPAVDRDSRQNKAAVNTDAPGMSDSLGANHPGSPNMGSADHTPGTTGTSGQ